MSCSAKSGYNSYRDLYKRLVLEIRDIKTDLALNKDGLIKTGYLKDEFNGEPKIEHITLIKWNNNNNVTLNELFTFMDNFENLAGIAPPLGLCNFENEFWILYKSINNLFPKLFNSSRNCSTSIKKFLNGIAIGLNSLYDNHLVPEVLLPNQLCIVEQNGMFYGQIWNLIDSNELEQLKFYSQFNWLIPLLKPSRSSDPNIIKLGFCIVYSIFDESNELFKYGMPGIDKFLEKLNGQLQKYRIHLLYDLIFRMIFQRKFNLSDFFKHPYNQKLTSIMEDLTCFKTKIQFDINKRANFDVALQPCLKQYTSADTIPTDIVPILCEIPQTSYVLLKLFCNFYQNFVVFKNEIRSLEMSERFKRVLNALAEFYVQIIKWDYFTSGKTMFERTLFPTIDLQLVNQINQILEYEGNIYDGYKTNMNILTENLDVIKEICFDSSLNSFGNVYRGTIKEGLRVKKIIFEIRSSNFQQAVNHQLREISNFAIIEGSLIPVDLYDNGIDNTIVYEHVDSTFARILTLNKSTFEKVNVNSIIKDYGRIIRDTLESGIINILMPSCFAVVFTRNKYLGRIIVFTSAHKQESDAFYGQFTWLKPHLTYEQETKRNNVVRFAVCMIYSIFHESVEQIQSSFPSPELLLTMLEDKMLKFNIMMLYSLLCRMIYDPDYTMEDFMSHVFCFSLLEVKEMIASARSKIATNKTFSAQFHNKFHVIYNDWESKISNPLLINGFLEKNTDKYEANSPLKLMKVIRDMLMHICDDKYGKLVNANGINVKYVNSYPHDERGILNAVYRMLFDTWETFIINVFDFLWEDKVLREAVLVPLGIHKSKA